MSDDAPRAGGCQSRNNMMEHSMVPGGVGASPSMMETHQGEGARLRGGEEKSPGVWQRRSRQSPGVWQNL